MLLSPSLGRLGVRVGKSVDKGCLAVLYNGKLRYLRTKDKDKIAGSQTLIVFDRAWRGLRPGENAHHQTGSFQVLKV